MTVLMSLRSRLMLARLAVELPLAEAPERLPEIALGSVDLALLTTDERSKDVQARFQELQCSFGQRVLLAIDNPKLKPDVCVPRRKIRYYRPHEWALLGRRVQDDTLLRQPDDLQFLLLPDARPDTPLFRAALEAQPPLLADSVPWFAAGDLQLEAVTKLVEAGARRAWLTGRNSVEELLEIDELLRDSWRGDPAAATYRGEAAAS